MEEGFVDRDLKRLPGIERRQAGPARVFNRREAARVAKAGVKAVGGAGVVVNPLDQGPLFERPIVGCGEGVVGLRMSIKRD